MGLEKIAEYKKKLGITTEELSRRPGVPLGALSKVLNGTTKDPRLEMLKAIARVLGLSLDDFDDGGETKSKPTYNDAITIYTRSKNNLSQEEKMRLARTILPDDEEQKTEVTVADIRCMGMEREQGYEERKYDSV